MSYFVKIADKKYGPFDAEKLKGLASAGRISRHDSISKDQATWVPAGNVKGLFPPAELVVPPETIAAPIAVIVREPVEPQYSEDLVVYTAQATRDAAVAAAKTTGQLSAKGAGLLAQGTMASAKAIGNAARSLKRAERQAVATAPRPNVSAFIAESLTSSEEVIHVARVHPAMLYEPIISICVFLLIAAGLSAVALAIEPLLLIPIGLVTFVVVLRMSFSLVKAIITLKTTECVLTNHRIIGKYGVITRRSMELLLVKVESVTVHQSFWGRALGFGSVVVTGTGNTPYRFLGIEEPLEFRKQVQEQITLKAR